MVLAAYAEVEVNEDGVLVLTDATFDEAIAANSKILVEFYAPWCGHCKQLAPEYAAAAKALKDDDCALAMVDATAEKEVGKKFSIQGFPTLKFFNNGKPSDYSGGRTQADIIQFMKKKSGPAAITIESEDDLTDAQEANDVFVLGVFSDAGSDAAKVFLEQASSDDENVYTISTDAGVRSSLAISGDTVVVLKSFDDLRADLAISSSTTAFDINNHVAGNVSPLINTYSKDKAKKIFSSPVKTHGLFFTIPDDDHHEPTIAMMTEAAKNLKGEVLFVNIPGTEQGILDYFSLQKSDLPKFILADMRGNGMKKFPMDGAISKDAVTSFAADFKAGSLKPVLKSEEPEASDTTGNVVTLRGTSFKEIVLDNDNDVLVEFYAPWCGHCKKLAPIYEELGEKFASNPKVTIAQMDATANEIDVEGVNVSGFPTLVFFKGNNKNAPRVYKGGRELDDLATFMDENAHHAEASSDEL